MLTQPAALAPAPDSSACLCSPGAMPVSSTPYQLGALAIITPQSLISSSVSGLSICLKVIVRPTWEYLWSSWGICLEHNICYCFCFYHHLSSLHFKVPKCPFLLTAEPDLIFWDKVPFPKQLFLKVILIHGSQSINASF